MIGFDVIDLEDLLIKKRGSRAMGLISNPDDLKISHPNLFWLFWTAKEASYKCHRLLKPFSPKQIPVQLSTNGDELSFTSTGVRGSFIINRSFIAALAYTEDSEEPEYHITIGSRSVGSSEVRKALVKLFNEKGQMVEVGRDRLGLPTLNNKPISISHHGRFGGFAYCEQSVLRSVMT